jgi:hypothetical protein
MWPPEDSESVWPKHAGDLTTNKMEYVQQMGFDSLWVQRTKPVEILFVTNLPNYAT